MHELPQVLHSPPYSVWALDSPPHRGYLLTHDEDRQVLVIDPGLQIDGAREFLSSRNLKLVAILLTQGGISCVGRTASLAARFGAPVFMHAGDLALLQSIGAQAQRRNWCEIHIPQISRLLHDGDILFSGSWTTKVFGMNSPTSGSVVYRIHDFAFHGRSSIDASHAPWIIDGARTFSAIFP